MTARKFESDTDRLGRHCNALGELVAQAENLRRRALLEMAWLKHDSPDIGIGCIEGAIDSLTDALSDLRGNLEETKSAYTRAEEAEFGSEPRSMSAPV